MKREDSPRQFVGHTLGPRYWPLVLGHEDILGIIHSAVHILMSLEVPVCRNKYVSHPLGGRRHHRLQHQCAISHILQIQGDAEGQNSDPAIPKHHLATIPKSVILTKPLILSVRSMTTTCSQEALSKRDLDLHAQSLFVDSPNMPTKPVPIFPTCSRHAHVHELRHTRVCTRVDAQANHARSYCSWETK